MSDNLDRCWDKLTVKRWLQYSLMNMRQLHILFNSAKTWTVVVCWFLCFAPNLPELYLKLFCSDVQNNFRLSSGKFGAKQRNRNKQSHVKFWLNWTKDGAVSYSLSCNSMNNLSSYCWLVVAKIRASDKDLPVLNNCPNSMWALILSMSIKGHCFFGSSLEEIS